MGIDIAKAVSEFARIRDKPYCVDVSDVKFGCNCSTKAHELQSILEKIGYQTRIMICLFDWRDGPFPKEILNLYDHQQETTHAWLQIRTSTNAEWQDIDLSWDKPLAKLGFKIAEWDGKGCTAMAVYPTYRYTFEEGQEYLKRSAADKTGEELYRRNNKLFFEAMNKWMNSARHD